MQPNDHAGHTVLRVNPTEVDNNRERSIANLESSLDRIGRTTLSFGNLDVDDDDDIGQTETERVENQVGMNGVSTTVII